MILAGLVWLLVMATALAQPGVVTNLPSRGIEGWVCLFTLVGVGFGVPAGVWRNRRSDSLRVGRWRSAWQVFSENRTARAGLGLLCLVTVVAALAPLLASHDPAAQGDLLTERMLSPTADHPFGTDRYARDIMSRVIFGARVSLGIGFLAMAISATVGTVLGAVAGTAGGWVDTVIMRSVDTVLAFPRLVLLIAIVAAIDDPSIWVIVLVLGLTQWPATARLVRAEALSLREREFVLAAEGLGFSRTRIIARHVVPNVLAPVIVAATLGIGNTIVLEAGLSFLGLGVSPPTPSWGAMVDAGRHNLLDAWWIATIPGLAIVFTVLAFNLVGDGLRDALDPRMGSDQ